MKVKYIGKELVAIEKGKYIMLYQLKRVGFV